jgi:hypothetical protein
MTRKLGFSRSRSCRFSTPQSMKTTPRPNSPPLLPSPHGEGGGKRGERVRGFRRSFRSRVQGRGPGVSTFSWLGERPQRNPSVDGPRGPSVARPGHPSPAGSGDRRADGPAVRPLTDRRSVY